ncbi:hypothetical protein GALL_360420 [mine drainage metagenome]|uniref:Uncharacterized protein n=1 Tax=mine drainage metagenome TaxID=410659 RepID=A0A1J5QF52_9ZZZZ
MIRVAVMSSKHLQNVLAMLPSIALRLQFEAIVDVLLEDDGERLSAELVAYELTGAALFTAMPER